MPFPIDRKYISEAEGALGVKFPPLFVEKMLKDNGGELVFDEDFGFQIIPFFDKSSRKRISRTCNHIIKENESAKAWRGFPENAIAIGFDGGGNYLILRHQGDGLLEDVLYFWDHETAETEYISSSILDKI
jgi:hypothetical protein